MNKNLLFIGLDVHKESIEIAIVEFGVVEFGVRVKTIFTAH